MHGYVVTVTRPDGTRFSVSVVAETARAAGEKAREKLSGEPKGCSTKVKKSRWL